MSMPPTPYLCAHCYVCIVRIAHILCPCLSRVCISMFLATSLPIRQAVCFWGNTVLADFPSVVKRRRAVWLCWSVTVHPCRSSQQCSAVCSCWGLLPRRRGPHFFDHWAPHPPLAQRQGPKPPISGCAWHCTQGKHHLNAHRHSCPLVGTLTND